MAEAPAVAQTVEEVAPGVWHWSISDERIGGFVGDSYAVAGEQGVVLIDPHGLAPEALAQLGPVEAIVLSTGSHQRSAWRLRQELGVPVHAPALSKEIDEEPDERYGDGDELPRRPARRLHPGRRDDPAHAAARRARVRSGRAPAHARRQPRLVPEEYAHDVDEARRSAEKLLDLPFSTLLLMHGGVVADDPKAQIRAAIG